MTEELKETISYLKENGLSNPEVGIILGTGLGALADLIDVEHTIDYEQIPNFPISTVEFHHGQLIYGTLSGKKVIAMKGRFHYYEGYSLEQVVFPVRVMKFLGISGLLISNAAGNLNKSWRKGEVMLLNDHIDLFPDNPLRGQNASKFGNIFVDMSQPYDKVLNSLLKKIAVERKINIREGVYAAVSGPNLETRAEYRYIRQMGADAVGMSTIPEVIAANQLALPCCAISVLTDDCDPDHLEPVKIDDILRIASIAEKDLITLYTELIKRI
jgi:purine-nucleoside phosphorylase